MSYDMSFSISTNAYNPVVFDKKPSLPDLSSFPPYIIGEILKSENINERMITNLKTTIIDYLSKTDNSEDNITKILEDFNTSYKDLPTKITNIEDSFKEIMETAKWGKSKKVPSTNSLSKKSEYSIGTEQIKTLGELFLSLYNECVNDENVESYTTAMLSKVIRKLTETHTTMGNGSRLKNLIETIASGIPSYSKQSTRDALINLQSYSMTLFDIIISHKNVRKSKAPIQTREAIMIQSLKNDRNEMINGRNLSDSRVQQYLQISKNQLENMQKTQTKESTNQVERIGRGLAKNFFKIARESGLRSVVINGMVAMITANMDSNKTRTNSSLSNKSQSNFKVQTFTEDNEIYVNFSGNLLNTDIKGSYSLSQDSIDYISKNAYVNTLNESNQQKQRITESSGFNDTSNESIWYSFNTFFFMYTSLMVWFILNPDNIFGIVIDIPEDDNLNFLYSRDFIDNISETLKNKIMTNGSVELKKILVYSYAKGWPLFMYG